MLAVDFVPSIQAINSDACALGFPSVVFAIRWTYPQSG
jgi:hypothetical protein